MIYQPSVRTPAASWRGDRHGAVSIIFATAIIPLAICVGLAVDYGFYIQAVAQTTMASDAAAIHAVRVAVTSFNAGASAKDAGITGGTAGKQWFEAQLGSLATGSVSNLVVGSTAAGDVVGTPNVDYDKSIGKFSATVSYKLKVPTHFGGLVNIASWTTSQASLAAVTANAFVEVMMLLDTSASMSIGTTATDMLKIEELSVCMPTAMASNYMGGGSEADVFQYVYSGANVGYGNNQTTPTPNSSAGACNPLYTNLSDSDPRLCQATPKIISNPTSPSFGATDVNPKGFCPPNTGVPTTRPVQYDLTYATANNPKPVANLPVPTCALSCHDDSGGNDLSGLVKSANLHNNAQISIRLDVVTAAAANVIQALIDKEKALGLPNQFSVGIGEINSSYGQQDYPKPGGAFVEAGTDLQAALTIAQTIQPTNNSTDIDDLLKIFASLATPSGTGGTPATPRKNLFLVTDGLQDNFRGGPAGTRWTALNPANCATLKTMEFNIFVLYTPYYPLPHHQYLNDGIMQLAEPLANSPITSALKACATKPEQFFQASSQTDINNAMQQMLNLALNQPATITQ